VSKRREGRIGVGVEPESHRTVGGGENNKDDFWRPDARLKGTHDTNGDTLSAPNAKML
jgi:hypothetical protein